MKTRLVYDNEHQFSGSHQSSRPPPPPQQELKQQKQQGEGETAGEDASPRKTFQVALENNNSFNFENYSYW